MLAGWSLLECSIYNLLVEGISNLCLGLLVLRNVQTRTRNSCTTREWEVGITLIIRSNHILKYLTGQWNQGTSASTYFQAQLYKHTRTVILIESVDKTEEIEDWGRNKILPRGIPCSIIFTCSCEATLHSKIPLITSSFRYSFCSSHTFYYPSIQKRRTSCEMEF